MFYSFILFSSETTDANTPIKGSAKADFQTIFHIWSYEQFTVSSCLVSVWEETTEAKKNNGKNANLQEGLYLEKMLLLVVEQ